ncbi:pyruvate kinase-like isoform X2 [Atheta coriaria]|uniref:pyruvate kinase-like isoform X2 n=1 Tax=Dalotia coriaria TaxID=877792 RepID=UPI0031F37132
MVDAPFFYEKLVKPGVIPRQGHAQRKKDELNHNAALQTGSRPVGYRKIGIWCDIGPASKDVATLEKLIANGINVACVPLSCWSSNTYPEIIRNIREAEVNENFKAGVPTFIAIAMETLGPVIRIGVLEGNMDCPVKKGDILRLTTDKAYLEKGNSGTVYINYEDILKIVQSDDRIFVSDGTISLIVSEIHGSNIITIIECDGTLKSLTSVFLPNIRPQLPSLSDQDKVNISNAMGIGIHYILAGRVRNAADVQAIRDYVGTAGEKIRIVARIDGYQAIQNLDEIMDVSDVILINRFYLGVEIPHEKVFIAQKSIIARCNARGMPVIVAKHFVDSMMYRSRPKRAETVDIANAVMDGADGIHISETVSGSYPVECISFTAATCIEAEAADNQWRRFRELVSKIERGTLQETLALCAVQTAYKVEAAAIITLAVTGTMVRQVASFKPNVPIIAIMKDEFLARQLNSCRAVFPIQYTVIEEIPVRASDVP